MRRRSAYKLHPRVRQPRRPRRARAAVIGLRPEGSGRQHSARRLAGVEWPRGPALDRPRGRSGVNCCLTRLRCVGASSKSLPYVLSAHHDRHLFPPQLAAKRNPCFLCCGRHRCGEFGRSCLRAHTSRLQARTFPPRRAAADARCILVADVLKFPPSKFLMPQTRCAALHGP